jgi:hypothetical protein
MRSGVGSGDGLGRRGSADSDLTDGDRGRLNLVQPDQAATGTRPAQGHRRSFSTVLTAWTEPRCSMAIVHGVGVSTSKNAK